VGSPMMGVNQSATKNQNDTISAVSPVQPPLRMPVADSGTAKTIVIARFSCLEARCVRRQAAVKAAKILPHVGLARSEQDPINRGRGAQYLYPPPPAGAKRNGVNAHDVLCQASCRWTLACPQRMQIAPKQRMCTKRQGASNMREKACARSMMVREHSQSSMSV
jgi:hypothetical protein